MNFESDELPILGLKKLMSWIFSGSIYFSILLFGVFSLALGSAATTTQKITPKTAAKTAPKTAPKTTDSKNRKGAKCTVDGHGPYELNFSKCLTLGANQARTNCVLKGKDAAVEVQFSIAKMSKNANCMAKLKVGTEDCLKAQCMLGVDTPQH